MIDVNVWAESNEGSFYSAMILKPNVEVAK